MNPAEMPDVAQDKLQTALRGLVSERKYDLWFSSLRATSVAPERVVLAVGNPFLLEWLQSRYLDVIQEAVEVAFGVRSQLDLVVDESRPAPAPARPADQTAANGHTPASDPAVGPTFFANHSDVTLHDTYTFEQFVAGPSNQLAHAAAMAVADAPAGAYNPLFLHGDVGLGKTHLLQAICHKAMRAGSQLKVLYLSSETFVNQFIAAIEQGDLARFRYKYRNVDLLLIDDIHLLANKERTQEEFFHTFNTLYNESKQIVLSSDCPPAEIPTLRERLVSRFEWGLVAEIAAPRYETRLAILRKKARERGIALTEPVLAYLAENIDRNIRELEGAVTKVVGYAKLINKEIDLDLAQQALGVVGRGEHNQHVTGVDRILDHVCQRFDVTLEDVQGRRRTQSVVVPRQVSMYLLRQLTNLSLEEIGQHFGGRDHSTVLYAVGKVKERMADDRSLSQTVRDLESRLRR